MSECKELEEYSKEMNLYQTMTLSSLIDSHRTLREYRERENSEIVAEMTRAREIGRQQGREAITHGQYIEVEKLKSMTMAEIAEFLSYY